jgi:formate hydrogenlyase transcriptional activator
LDEVCDIPPALQPKLLRVLQEQEFERLGSGRTHKVDVRLLAATNRDRVTMVARGQFRGDLYYRLNVFPIFLPALRERRADISALVTHFEKQFSRRMGKQVDSIPPETMAAFQWYSWPGNIPTEIIAAKIKMASAYCFDVSVGTIKQMRSSGVPDQIILAMVRRGERGGL